MPAIPYIISIRRVVRFAPTETDQQLLQALEEVLETQFHGNFSALCKQALRIFLLPEEEGRLMSPVVMQEQILELQDRVAMLEALGDRLGLLSPGGLPDSRTLPIAVESSGGLEEPLTEPIEEDPLLSRLALLLEDF